MIWRLYKIDGPNGRSYIGQTVQSINARWRGHCKAKSGCSALRDAIRKYGRDAFSITHVASCRTQVDADATEQILIENCRTLTSCGGYNIVVGGQGCVRSTCYRGHSLTQENRRNDGACRICHNAAVRKWRASNSELVRRGKVRRRIKHKYVQQLTKLSIAQFDVWLTA